MKRSLTRGNHWGIALIPLVLVAAPAGKDFSFQLHTKTEMTGGDGQTRTMDRVARVMLSGDKARIESQSAGDQQGPKTTIIVSNGGKTTTVLNDEDKTYFEFTRPGAAGAQGGGSSSAGGQDSMRGGGGMMGNFHPEVSDTKVAVEDLGDGPAIEGHPTKHFRMTENATVKMSFGGQDRTTKTETTTEYYFATDLGDLLTLVNERGGVDGLANAGASLMMMRGFGRGGPPGGGGGMRGGFGGGFMGRGGGMAMMDTTFARQVRTEREKLYKGVPVKVVMTVKMTTDGQAMTTVNTTTVEGVKNDEIPATTFSVPDGYKKQDMPAPGGMRGGFGPGAPAQQHGQPR